MRLSATIRITIGLVLVSASVLLLMQTLGLGPDELGANLKGRRAYCEALAIHSSMLIARDDQAALRESLSLIAKHHSGIWTIRLSGAEQGELLKVSGSQRPSESDLAQAMVVSVPLMSERGLWGTLDVTFQPLVRSWLSALWEHPSIRLLMIVVAGNCVVFFLYLKRNLEHLDPSQVVPDRVRNALDTIPGGLVILDKTERILLANRSFAAAVGSLPGELQGRELSRFRWLDQAGQSLNGNCPWQESLQFGVAHHGSTITLAEKGVPPRTYTAQSSPILADDGSQRGALVSFEDVTELENKQSELTRALDVLRSSRDEVRKQNEELTRLATRDPLTDCLNRRSFYESLESHWSSAQRYNHPLGCVMVDIDHFKSINDTHGHSAGDVVLQKVAARLRETVRASDIVCRYGGEEFCILLPQLTIDEAETAAERFRAALESLQLPDMKVTASLGVSSNTLGATDTQDMIDQADKCLYVAKRNGRNQVVRWDEVSDDIEVDESALSRTPEGAGPASVDSNIAIPYHAVSALISALAYRDSKTAEHSRRVADLCVLTASGLMSARECYELEIAALLHDIGKIGVPDSILLKPGPLTKEEWDIMGVHDRVGVEIIDSAFASPALTKTIENHHAWYSGNPREPNLPTGEDIPLGARILAICDAYDAITSDRVYRKGRSQQEAFAELRRCITTQFDGELVERFIGAISSRPAQRHPATSGLTRQTAVMMGQNIGRLAEALDSQDMHGLAALAGRLQQTAPQQKLPAVAEVAGELEQAVQDEAELHVIVELTSQLMDLCRDTQSAFLNGEDHRSHAQAICS